MAYLTRAQAINASQRAWGTRTAAESAVTKSLSTPASTDFDVFLSHSYEDAEVIAGVARLLEADGLTVYVDWVVDRQLDRSSVTPDTAKLLRKRMNHCYFLLFVSSSASTSSKWMPWELGYFDGKHQGRIGILPIVESTGQGFLGQEYLGIYPTYEVIGIRDFGNQLARSTSATKAMMLRKEAKRPV
jgi:hypothetical protein